MAAQLQPRRPHAGRACDALGAAGFYRGVADAGLALGGRRRQRSSRTGPTHCWSSSRRTTGCTALRPNSRAPRRGGWSCLGALCMPAAARWGSWRCCSMCGRSCVSSAVRPDSKKPGHIEPGLLRPYRSRSVDDLHHAPRARLHDHRTVVDHRVTVTGCPVFRRHLVVGHAGLRQHGADADLLLVDVGRAAVRGPRIRGSADDRRCRECLRPCRSQRRPCRRRSRRAGLPPVRLLQPLRRRRAACLGRVQPAGAREPRRRRMPAISFSSSWSPVSRIARSGRPGVST